MFLTHLEHTRDREIIWFWTPDTMMGPVHSNDYIGLKFSPNFYGQVSTSQNRFHQFQANPYFEFEPLFGVPALHFPDPPEFAGGEGIHIGNPDEGMQYRLVMENDFGFVYCWRDGLPFEEELEPIDEYFWEDFEWLYFDSPLEMYGVIDGIITIGCSNNIRLLDNVLYAAAEPEYGMFVEDECDDMLGVISAREIIIANTTANGRDNGWNGGRFQQDRHSIVINAALAAFGESLTFEDQNDEWDRRQGPAPDERGTIYLTGSLAQYRRGYVHRSNHQGTGYRKKYVHDTRLIDNPPPLFPEIDERIILGEGNNLELNAENSPYYVIGDGGYHNITMTAGTEIILKDSLALTCEGELRIFGTEDNPVIIRREDPEIFSGYPGLILDRCDSTFIRNLQLEEGITWSRELGPGAGIIESCDFSDSLKINYVHDIEFRNCTFRDTVRVYRSGNRRRIAFRECEFDGSLFISTYFDTIELVDCEISDLIDIGSFSTEFRMAFCNLGGSLLVRRSATNLRIEDCQIRGNDFFINSEETQLIHCDVWGEVSIRDATGRIEDSQFSGQNLIIADFDQMELFDCEIDGNLIFSNGHSVLLTESQIVGEVQLIYAGNIRIMENRIGSGISVANTNGCIVHHNVLHGGVKFTSRMDMVSGLTLNNNTIVDADTAGLLIREANWFTANNNIFYNNRTGIFVETCHKAYTTSYNCSFMNSDGHYLGMIHSHSDFISDPMFVNPQEGDYNLSPASPCIDAGHPDFSWDSDGTRIDIGAIPYEHSMSVENERTLTRDFSITASPNPFNSRTNIRFVSEIAGRTIIDIYDLNGRKVNSLLYEVSKGINSIPLSGHELGGTGMFFVKIRCGNDSRIVKLIYLP